MKQEPNENKVYLTKELHQEVRVVEVTLGLHATTQTLASVFFFIG